jgi:hypothetical protein
VAKAGTDLEILPPARREIAGADAERLPAVRTNAQTDLEFAVWLKSHSDDSRHTPPRLCAHRAPLPRALACQGLFALDRRPPLEAGLLVGAEVGAVHRSRQEEQGISIRWAYSLAEEAVVCEPVSAVCGK